MTTPPDAMDAAGPIPPIPAAAPASSDDGATAAPQGDGAGTPAPPRRGSRIVMLIKAVACLAVVAFVTVALVHQFRQVRWDEMHFHAGLAALAVLCMLGVSAVQLLMFRTLLLAFGYRLPWRVTLGTAWIPPLGKYIPGKVAAVAGAVYLQRQNGVPGAVAVSVAVMLDGLAVIAGLIVSAPLLIWHEGVRARVPTAGVWCAVLALGGIVLLHPRVFVKLLNLLLRLAGRQPLKVVPSMAKFAVPVLAAFGQWLYAGLGLWLMTRAVTEVSPATIPLFISTAALAMTVSYLALFAPGGVGVREWLYLAALGPVIGPRAAIVVVAMRIVQTLIELSLAAIGAAALRNARRVVGG
jgi:hypothetical protein